MNRRQPESIRVSSPKTDRNQQPTASRVEDVHALIDALPLVLFRLTIQPEPKFEYIRGGFLDIFGLNSEEVLSDFTRFWERLSADERLKARPFIDDPALIPHRFQLHLKRLNGEQFTANCQINHTLNPAGATVGIEGILYAPSLTGDDQAMLTLPELRCYQLFEDVRGGVIVCNSNGRIINANNTAARILGFNDSLELLRHYSAEFYYDPTERSRIMERLEREGEICDIQIMLKHKDGEPIYARCSIRLVRDNTGQPVRVESVFTDETDKYQREKELIESQAHFKGLVDLLPNAVVIHAKGRILFANQRCADLVRVKSPAALVGRQVMDFVHPDYRPIVAERISRIQVAGATVPTIEELFVRDDGSTVDVEVVARPIQFQGEDAVLVVATDISERRKWEQELIAREMELTAIFESAPIPMLLLDQNWNITQMNRAAADLTGFQRQEGIGRPLGAVIGCLNKYSADTKCCGSGEACRDCNLRNAVINTLDTGPTFNKVPFELLVKLKGKVQRLTLMVSTAIIAQGNGQMILICLKDLTELKSMEDELALSRARYQQMFDAMRSGVLICEAIDNGRDFRILDVNSAATRIEKQPKRALIKQRFTDVFPKADEFGLFDIMRRVNRTGIEEFLPVSWVEGKRVKGWREYYVYRLPDGIIVVIYNDITREREALIAQQESERRYRELLENASASIFIIQDGLIKFFNSQAVSLTGIPPVDLSDMKFEELLAEDFRHRFREWHRDLLTDDDVEKMQAFRLATHERGEQWIEVNTARITWEGRPAVLHFINDITAQMRLQAALEQNEKSLHKLYEISADAICICKDWTYLVDVNQKFTQWFGLSIPLGEAVLFDPAQILASEHRNAYIEGRNQFSNDARTDFNIESVAVKKDGNLIEVEITETYFKSGSHFYTLTVIRDISRRKSLEAQLRQSQKMEAVGQLAGGVAHDFNNLLTVIYGHIDLAMKLIKPEDPVHGDLEQIQLAADRAAALTRQLLAFSRKQPLTPSIMDLNETVRKTERMLKRIIGEDIRLTIDLADCPVMVKVDAHQVEQVIVNLVVNARDALPNGGDVIIRSGLIEITAEETKLSPEMQAGEFAWFSVQDNGVGMLPEVCAKIFEPFFTTKPEGKGTGLGLSTVYGIVKQSGGFITVDTKIGEGSTFRIYLPPAEPTDLEPIESSDST